MYLAATWVGASWSTATLRGTIAAAIVYFVGKPLLYPLVDTILSAIAEAERERQEAEE